MNYYVYHYGGYLFEYLGISFWTHLGLCLLFTPPGGSITNDAGRQK